MLLQYWSFCEQKCLKRARQIDFIVNNVDNNLNNWYYLYLHVGRQLYLNGLLKFVNVLHTLGKQFAFVFLIVIDNLFPMR